MNTLNRLKYLKLMSVMALIILTFYSCNNNPSPDKLQLSVKNVFNLLPEKPQFVMYVNFKYMRTTEFWKLNISDSIFKSENSFGSLLNLFKTATGATITNGLDEMFFANSWTGENAIVMKGSFDKNKMMTYFQYDTVFSKTEKPDGFTYYKHRNSNTLFFLKDNFTLCASNYEEQLLRMKNTTDTSNSGLLLNNELMKAIESIINKESLWLVSAEKTFIRGVFANFIDLKSGKGFGSEIQDSSKGMNTDSLNKSDDIISNKLYEKVNSISLNAKMKSDTELLLQFECIDKNAASYIDKLFNGIIGIAKITAAGKKDKGNTAFEKILNEISLQNYESTFLIKIKINSENIKEFRDNSIINNNQK